MKNIDAIITELDALREKVTGGLWTYADITHTDWAYLIQLRDAYPALASELRELRCQVDSLKSEAEELRDLCREYSEDVQDFCDTIDEVFPSDAKEEPDWADIAARRIRVRLRATELRRLEGENQRLRAAAVQVSETLGAEGSGLDVQTACEEWDGSLRCGGRGDSQCFGCMAYDEVEGAVALLKAALAAAGEKGGGK